MRGVWCCLCVSFSCICFATLLGYSLGASTLIAAFFYVILMLVLLVVFVGGIVCETVLVFVIVWRCCCSACFLLVAIVGEKWCEALSSRGQVSEIRGSSRKWGATPLRQVLDCQIVTKWRILDSYSNDFHVDSACVHPRFWIGPQICNIRRDLVRMLDLFLKSYFVKLRFMHPRGLKCEPSWLLMPHEAS